MLYSKNYEKRDHPLDMRISKPVRRNLHDAHYFDWVTCYTSNVLTNN